MALFHLTSVGLAILTIAPPGIFRILEWSRRPDKNEYTETIGPNRYQVVEIKTVLFPTVVGVLVIEPTRS